MAGQILVEESVLGWEELELEVVRDSKNQMITVCFIENIDAIGVHTGDSFCAAPMLTISPELQQRLQEYAYSVVEAIEVIGGTNVQFAHDPRTGRVVIIEINPRTSRSSALASKATGFPIAYVSAMLAAGLTLDEIPYWRDGSLDKYTPSGDYVVIKFARWAFEKFPGAQDKLGTQMRAVGEVMSIGKSYKEAFQKAIRSLEINRYGLSFAGNFNNNTLDELLSMLTEPTSQRQFIMYEALRKGADVEQLYKLTHIKPYFIEQMKELVLLEEEILKCKGSELPDELLIKAKKDGFSDRYLAQLLDVSEALVRRKRTGLGLTEGWEAVPVSGVENASYYFSSYNISDKTSVTDKPKVMILGGGPNRIGQGIEFDYCCVHAAFAIRDAGFESIMVNCNPETVSTDYDTSDKLYFEPLTAEAVQVEAAPLEVEGRQGEKGQTMFTVRLVRKANEWRNAVALSWSRPENPPRQVKFASRGSAAVFTCGRRLVALDHERLRTSLDDFRGLSAEAFLEKSAAEPGSAAGVAAVDGEHLPGDEGAGPGREKHHRPGDVFGSRKAAQSRARVARASRLFVEGVHDATLVERVWGDDLRAEGIVVESLDGLDNLADALAEFEPGPRRRAGVLVDHLVAGSKEHRLTGSVGPHVLVCGHPYIDVWEAVKPASVKIRAWPVVPRGTDWKTGVCTALGWGAPRDGWRRVLSGVSDYRDIEVPLLRAVEELIDFVTAEAG